MSDRATPNLPSRDLARTEAFYTGLGFVTGFKDEGWLIMNRGPLSLEFFPLPRRDPNCMWFSCCLRMDDAKAFYADCVRADVPEREEGLPRLRPIEMQDWGGRLGALVDPDGNLIRLILT
jgi:catechol 2,3-dioxygenase-like lactoylglutathione lyase family enzyme